LGGKKKVLHEKKVKKKKLGPTEGETGIRIKLTRKPEINCNKETRAKKKNQEMEFSTEGWHARSEKYCRETKQASPSKGTTRRSKWGP